MSLLKKLNKSKSRVFTPKKTATAPEFTDIESARPAVQNLIFRSTSASYALLQRLFESRDKMMRIKKEVKSPETYHDRMVMHHLNNVIKALSKADEEIRTSIIQEDGVSNLDEIHDKIHRIINKMDFMSVDRYDLLERVIDAMITPGRFLWIDKEDDYRDNLLVVMQAGLDLASKGRKKVTINDLKPYLQKQ